MTNTPVVVIGGGAAGMMAALAARQTGAQVTLVEPNEKLGRKLYITGKGRCKPDQQIDIRMCWTTCLGTDGSCTAR